MLHLVLFIFFGLVACVTSLLVVTRKNPIISALFLIVNFAALAGLYILLYAQFIAVVQIIVYAGAIMVLFLFVIMLLRPENEKPFFTERPAMKWAALSVSFLVFVQIAYVLWTGLSRNPVNQNAALSLQVGTVESIGKALFTDYLLPFESIGFVLLAATIGAFILAKKKID